MVCVCFFIFPVVTSPIRCDDAVRALTNERIIAIVIRHATEQFFSDVNIVYLLHLFSNCFETTSFER